MILSKSLKYNDNIFQYKIVHLLTVYSFSHVIMYQSLICENLSNLCNLRAIKR